MIFKKKTTKKAGQKQSFGKRVVQFFSDIKAELKRVSWPDRKRLKLNTATVVSIILLSALMIFIFDSLISFVFNSTGFYHIENKTQPVTVSTEGTDAPAATEIQVTAPEANESAPTE